MSVSEQELAKQIRILRKQLERSEADRAELEITKEKNDALLNKVIVELHASKRDIELKSEQLETILRDLNAAQEELVQSEKLAALGQLVAGVAHEINTPVGIGVTAASHLRGSVQELTEKLDNETLTRRGLEKYIAGIDEGADIILRNLSRAAELIKNFKQVAVDRSFQGSRVFNVADYLDSVMGALHTPLKRQGVKVSVNGRSDLMIDSDPGLFSQVITNFVMNSLMHAFTPGAGGTIEIEIEAEGDCLRLQYVDDGVGIAPEHMDQIFEPFFTTRRGRGGSGLGLHIVFNIVVDKLKGTIQCDSAPGQGCCFTVLLPGLKM